VSKPPLAAPTANVVSMCRPHARLRMPHRGRKHGCGGHVQGAHGRGAGAQGVCICVCRVCWRMWSGGTDVRMTRQSNQRARTCVGMFFVGGVDVFVCAMVLQILGRERRSRRRSPHQALSDQAARVPGPAWWCHAWPASLAPTPRLLCVPTVCRCLFSSSSPRWTLHQITS
jgi:hypothetical protein